MRRILLVDDSTELLRGLQRSLRRLGHQVVAASSAAQALSLSEVVDVGVFDYHLEGGQTGDRVARVLHAKKLVRHVVFFSSEHAPSDLGPTILKPNVPELLRTVTALLAAAGPTGQ